MKTLFVVSLFLVVYTYIGYPLVLWILTKIRPPDVLKSKIKISPAVSVIITARNEADKIRNKINNTLTLNYPPSLLEVIVASDASDDGTDDIVKEYAAQGIKLVRARDRKGKEHVQGLAVAEAKGAVLVFSDAASILERDTVERLVQNFADPTVGAVSTEDVIVDTAGDPTAEGLYVKYEMWVRRLESRFHSLVGLSGSCFAVRRELCTDWSPTLASDFMGALRAARGGFRSVADPAARAKFPAVMSPRLEMPRRIRTFLRGITALMANLDMLNPFRYGRFAFQLASHKLLRFVAPFLLLTTLVMSGLLAGEQPFVVFFWMQVSFYGLGVIGSIIPVLQRNRMIRVANYFTMVQWAMLLAWVKYAWGEQQVAWEPSRRPGIVTRDHGSAR